MGYNYAVLGAGRQGTAAAYDMAKRGNADRVLIIPSFVLQLGNLSNSLAATPPTNTVEPDNNE